ncbi:deaminase [Glutamicibacter sp. PS]|uniref:deaminase n=1 Tax=Glutamicibacter sp. PS TaxID=3075634 RepID=UPI0028509A74|nr:deaminase [Glutamicibacter sp. PS]MDR4533045.1 deaminase [Glutamicibacter sp. PS]
MAESHHKSQFILEEPSEQDIVIGIVAPIGADVERVRECMKKELADFGYETKFIRLSNLLEASKMTGASSSERLMDAGDRLREAVRDGSAVAAVAIREIRHIRRGKKRDRVDPNTSSGSSKLSDSKGCKNLRENTEKPRFAWILHTLKHPSEVDLLRHVYGSRFTLIGVNDKEEHRAVVLESKLRRHDPNLSDFGPHVTALLERDQKSPNKYGQNVRDTNSLADFYIEVGHRLIAEVKRTIGLLFGKPFETPTRDEQNMFYAYAASLRSSDSGRQVGAVIARENGDVIAIGVNEVPKAGGGQYWNGDSPDARDFQLGRDNNRATNHDLLREVVQQVIENLRMSSDGCGAGHCGCRALSLDDVDSLIENGPLSKTRAASLIEFGRVTHAEMSAITDCARNGVSSTGATMYVTAFPCHMCMRLIIASGITRIVYVDPYPKSLAPEMYKDSLGFGKDESGVVKVQPFVGASRRIFSRVFELDESTRFREPNGVFAWIPKSELKFRSAPHHGSRQTFKREKQVKRRVDELLKNDSEISNLIK